MKWHEPKLGEFRTECPIGFKLSYFYQKNLMMMTEFSTVAGPRDYLQRNSRLMKIVAFSALNAINAHSAWKKW
jgi:hypothetical protein